MAQGCAAKAAGRAELLPQIRPRPATTHRRYVAFVVVDKGKVLVRQRPADAVNAHLWEFPNVEVSLQDGDPVAACRRALGGSPGRITPVATIRHSITRYRIRMDFFEIRKQAGMLLQEGRWLRPKDMAKLPFASAHKKVLSKLDLAGRPSIQLVKTIDKPGE